MPESLSRSPSSRDGKNATTALPADAVGCSVPDVVSLSLPIHLQVGGCVKAPRGLSGDSINESVDFAHYGMHN